jgi:hypothetical protein
MRQLWDKIICTVSHRCVCKLYYFMVTFQVLTAANMKITVFWDVAPCSLVETDRPMMEAVNTSETSVNFYETTRRSIPEGCYFHTFICWNANIDLSAKPEILWSRPNCAEEGQCSVFTAPSRDWLSSCRGHHPHGRHNVTPQTAHLGVDTWQGGRTPTKTAVSQQRKPQ